MLLKIIFLFLATPKIHAQTNDCDLILTGRNAKIYLNVFRWRIPLDSFNGTKEKIENGNTIRIICENGFLRNDFPEKSYLFECKNGKFNESLTYEDFLCKSDFHKNTQVERISDVQMGSRIFACRGNGLEVYRVNSRKMDGSLKALYNVCFDKNVMRTKFVFQVNRKDSSTKTNRTRHDVWGFDYFGKNPYEKFSLSKGYVARYQKIRISNAFSNNKNRKYPYNFNRGHLAPYADFIDFDDKKASCEYINVAPQWREFNGNSWSVVERKTREMIGNNPSEWEIYTGVHGSISTPRGPLFVSNFFDGKSTKNFVPIPKLFWKLVYNRMNRNESKVYVGVNNPELDSPEKINLKGYLFCRPKMINEGGKYFLGSEFHGFIYECEMDEFLAKLEKEEKIVRT